MERRKRETQGKLTGVLQESMLKPDRWEQDVLLLVAIDASRKYQKSSVQ